ncbi:hypothetical protein CRENBAI_019822 [Crenichthys baileyi]|uniref:Uncharacterized protein n=1 Tax=Crenichthys baileyi TaxID=28760 RepID=A0AAV9RQB9_9TELE
MFLRAVTLPVITILPAPTPMMTVHNPLNRVGRMPINQIGGRRGLRSRAQGAGILGDVEGGMDMQVGRQAQMDDSQTDYGDNFGPINLGESFLDLDFKGTSREESQTHN